MGYYTDFDGQFEISPALTPEHITATNNYDLSRPMEHLGFCNWKTDGSRLFSPANKAYYAQEWLRDMVEYFFKPNGYTLNGKVEWNGEDKNDSGVISVYDNIIYITPYVRTPGKTYSLNYVG
jgi:hypothetical protein